MRIALINTFSPFVRGGAEILVDDLYEQLQVHGHETYIHRIPFPYSFEAPLIATIESARLLCFDEYDKVIAFKFPTYCIQHREKVMWLFHQFRQVYDLWGREHGLQPDALGLRIQTIVKAVDQEDIPSSRNIFTIAREVSNRLEKFNNINSTVLYPPLKNYQQYYNDTSGDYLFYPSRVNSMKRQHLAIEAMCHVKSGVRLVITGVCEGDYFEQLKRLIRDNSLEGRVEFRNEWITDDEKRKLIANSLGVIFIPYREDYGFVSLEAMYSAKPIITCSDSGGTREFVADGINGFEVPADPSSIASAMDKLYLDKRMAERMGKEGLDEIIRRDITWPATIQRLLS